MSEEEPIKRRLAVVDGASVSAAAMLFMQTSNREIFVVDNNTMPSSTDAAVPYYAPKYFPVQSAPSKRGTNRTPPTPKRKKKAKNGR